jgi:MFS family permease
MRERLHFLLLNLGHLLDHLFMLVFATVAALALTREWGLSYAELIPYATPGFVAFGAFAMPAGWLADRWSREGMMVVFFIGIGLASVACALVSTPLQIGIGLFAIGVFAAIYHPVGIGLVLDGTGGTGMRIAVNGVWGNMGVAIAALLTGFMIDTHGWRSAFVWPGVFSVLLGLLYWQAIYRKRPAESAPDQTVKKKPQQSGVDASIFRRTLGIILLTTAIGGLVFQSTTFALPRVLSERAADIAPTATLVGWLAFMAFAIGSLAQLVVGYLLDRVSARYVFMTIAVLQIVFFAAMISASGVLAIVVAVGFMLAAFGQIPINDVLVGRIAVSEWRSRILALRYTTTITVMACSVPFIAWVYAGWGFSRLFVILTAAATAIFIAVCALPLLAPRKPAAA